MKRATRKKRANAAVTRLLDEILSILKRDSKTVGDLARELDRSYNQMYDWVVLRKFNPRADALLSLTSWKTENESSMRVPPRLIKPNMAHHTS